MHTQFFTLSLWFSLDISPHYSTIGVLVQSEDKYNSLTAYACFISKANFSLCVPPCVWEIESPLCWTHTDLWLCAWPDKANLLLCVSEELLGKVNIKTNTVNQYNLWRNHIYWQKKKNPILFPLAWKQLTASARSLSVYATCAVESSMSATLIHDWLLRGNAQWFHSHRTVDVWMLASLWD